MLHLFVSIVNYNGNSDTFTCLESLDKSLLNNISLQVIVVDNASEKPFALGSKTYQNFTVTIIRNKLNTGFAGGHNIGIRYALDHGADYLMVLNNDTTVEVKMIQILLDTAEKNKSAGILTPKIYFAKGHEYHKNRYSEKEQGKVIWYAGGIMDWENVTGKHRGVDEVDAQQFNNLEKTDFASGCCMLMNKETVKKVGLLDERYFLYYEDSDYNERVKRTGSSILYVPSAVMWHINAGSTGGSGSNLQDYFISRNRMLFGLTYAPLRSKLALIRESWRLLKTGRTWQKKGVRDFYLRRWGKGSFIV